MPTIIILLSPNNLTIIGVNKEGRNIAITCQRLFCIGILVVVVLSITAHS
jgi:hypothetical protein